MPLFPRKTHDVQLKRLENRAQSSKKKEAGRTRCSSPLQQSCRYCIYICDSVIRDLFIYAFYFNFKLSLSARLFFSTLLAINSKTRQRIYDRCTLRNETRLGLKNEMFSTLKTQKNIPSIIHNGMRFKFIWGFHFIFFL